MSATSIFSKTLASAILLGGTWGSVLAGTTSFDSAQEFSGTQGAGNWQYGYYTTPSDADSFVQMSVYNQTFANAWSESTSTPPWTLLWAEGGHPNGSNSGAIHDAVRRWTSDADGVVNIEARYAMANVGQTVVGFIAGNALVWSGLATGTEQTFALSHAVAAGQHLDFFINSNGLDYNDSTNFAVIGQVTAVPEVATLAMMLAGMGVLGLLGWRRRAG